MLLLLDIARGLACLWVFFFHLHNLFDVPSPRLAEIASYGHLGVPMFFVISGYVITYAAESSRRAHKPAQIFLWHRFRRIYPTYWASIAVALALPFLMEFISSFKTGQYVPPESMIARYTAWEWVNVVALTKVFWADSSDLAAEFAAINTVYWTLAIEFQFYLVVYLALCLGKYYRHAIALVSAAAILLIFIPNTLNYGLFIHHWPAFSVGIGLAYLHKSELKFRVDSIRKFGLLVVFTGITVAVTNYLAPFDIRTNTLLFAGIFGVLLWLYADLEIVLQRLKRSNSRIVFCLLEPWLVLGAMSYSAYLLHLKLYLLPFMFASQLFNEKSLALGLVTIFCTLVLSYPFYYFVERRFLSRNYKQLHRTVVQKSPASPR